jgi:hypothetical protein
MDCFTDQDVKKHVELDADAWRDVLQVSSSSYERVIVLAVNAWRNVLQVSSSSCDRCAMYCRC